MPLGKEKPTDIFLTQFGASIGKCAYFLVTETAAFALSFLDYERVSELNFIPYSLLDHEAQDRVWDCWKTAEFVV
jgi:hypothetical protein